MKNDSPFLIYDAAAGSGKTYTLVKQYLGFLLNQQKNNYYQSLLALTFTNKAVAEMKDRIIENLLAFSEKSSVANPPPMMQDLAGELSLGLPKIQARAKAILTHLLHNYAAFSVETIDKFNHRLIRTFAKDLSLPSNFEVVLDPTALLTEAVDKLIDKTGVDQAITKVLVAFALEKTDDDKSWDISKDIFKAAKLLNNEDDAAHLSLFKDKTLSDFEDFKKELHKNKHLGEGAILKAIKVVTDIIETHGLDRKSFSRGSFITFIERLKSKEYGKIEFSAMWIQDLAQKPMYGVTWAKKNETLAAVIDQNQSVFAAFVAVAHKQVNNLRFIAAILKNLTPLSVINLVSKELALLQEEQSLVPIAQFNALIHKEIKDQPAPFIYERLGERYSHFFIDEFQDTSVMQWQNMIPLLDNSLSQAHSSKEGSLLLVGDVKQAIYRWRGGNPEQFLSLIHEKSAFDTVRPVIENLPKNYRSLKEIINFNNGFFTYASQFLEDPLHKKLYIDGNRQEVNQKAEGYINLEFIDAKNKEEQNQQYAEKTLAIVKQLNQQGFAYSDICVLTRKKDDGVFLSTYLMEHEIGVISSETLLLENAGVVSCIFNTILLSVQPTDTQTKIRVLDFLHAHFKIAIEKHSFFTSFLEKGALFSQTLKKYDIDFDLLQVAQKSLYQGAEYIIKQFGLDKIADAYLYGFMDLIFEYQQKPQADTLGFLDFWETKRQTASIASGENTNGVQFMTIHKAKGLEFPAVIFPYASIELYNELEPKTWISVPETWSQNFEHTLINYNKNIAEFNDQGLAIHTKRRQTIALDNYNLLYVTLTRAVEQLYIITLAPKEVKDTLKNFQQLFAGFLKHQGLWDENKKVYTFGNFSPQTHGKNKQSITTVSPKFITSTPQEHNLHIINNKGIARSAKIKEAIVEGNLFHDTMEEIKYHGDQDFVFQKLRRLATISEEKIAALQLEVQTVIKDPALQHLFENDAQVFNERDIITRQGYTLRPDRLNFHPQTNSVTIVDYKTGTPSYEHEDQINGYATALVEMGYTIEDKILVYTNQTILINKI
ncbi:UvrD-helicase domain-containing protein [Flavobacteriaceae bacterium]|nr:UvrD-helicase domain-containing protein [Flavobacteriaceae bacterium]